MTRVILFDGEQVSELKDLVDRPRRLSGSALLWIDLDGQAEASVDEVAEAFDLDDGTRERLAKPHERAVFDDHGRYLHVTAYAPREDDRGTLHALECVVGENWVVTAHDRPIDVLDEFAARVSGSGDTGSLDGPSFLAALLEWVLGSYTETFERIEQRLEDFEVQAMRGRGNDEDVETLVAMRLEVGTLRRALSAHRSALVALTHPELEALADDTASERFVSLFSRFESTLQEARDAREAIVGAFDVLIARSGHQTNEIMKVLTLVSVIMLPGALIAGVLGMNFEVGFFRLTWLFWVFLALIIAVAPVTLGVAKRRGWI